MAVKTDYSDGLLASVCEGVCQHYGVTQACDLHALSRTMDASWTIWRASFTCAAMGLVYMHHPSENVSHKQMNDRFDLHYLALLHPGMTLLTRDRKMAAFAPYVSPGSKVAKHPEDVELGD